MRLGVEAALVGGRIVSGDVEILEGRIARYSLPSARGHGIACAGFVDLQVNGFAGVDLLTTDAQGYRRVGAALLETGVTSYLPTLITAPEEMLLAALREVPRTAERDHSLGAHPLGAHLEGPFLSPARLGAHPPSARRDPDSALLTRLLASGPVRLVTLAPELPGAAALVSLLLAHGVTVSYGHTDATAVEAGAAFDLGVRSVTHLFNAMRPFAHRDPGIAGVALTRDDVVVQLIVDGVHVASEAVLLACRAAAGRVALVTDSIAAAGAGDGDYPLAGGIVRVRDGIARGPGGMLAGSTLTMIQAVRNLHALGVPLADALSAATAVPARVLGDPAHGRLELGLPADVVVLTDALEVERVYVGGEPRLAA